ncbi:MAG: transporter substrate-binding domain-containing protein [Chromatiaceae bacterium]|nr:transporter substrate-binding domain-containing protein [Chromatiaceae bacterium]MCP5315130.1 transporter substrate-binding domain-containing protein [Chromatiaceae bacterium]
MCTRLLLLALLLLTAAPPSGATQRIGLFVPHTGEFWGKFTEFAEAAAHDLDIDLQVFIAGRSPERMLEQVRQVTADGIEGILFTDYQGFGESILQAAEANKTPAVLVNAALLDPRVVPRNHYRYWIGGVAPDDRESGVRLATSLIASAAAKGAKEFNILAYSGSKELPMLRRLEGFKAVVDARSDVHLVDIFPINDGEDAVIEAFDSAIAAHPAVNIVWSFHDQLALTAARHYHQMRAQPDISFGGINWTGESMDGLERGLLDIDLGGHVFDGAQGVIMLHDYLNGHDFADERVLFQSNMYSATTETAAQFKRILADPLAIDYRALSKSHNPSLKQYRFDLNEIARRTGSAADLTQEERDWVRTHPVAKAGGMLDWAPFDFAEDGVYTGATRDFFELISQNTGLQFDFTLGEWTDQFDALREGRIDVLGSTYYTERRDSFLSFSQPYLEVLDYLFVRDDLGVDRLEDLSGKRVAIPEGYALNDTLAADFPGLRIVRTHSMSEAIDAVADGRAEVLYDAYAVLSHMLQRRGITNIVPFRSTRHLGANQLHFVTRDDQPALAAIIRKGLDAITAPEKQAVYERWLSPVPVAREPELDLTHEERAWLRDHPQIRLRVDPDWPPYEFVDSNGELRGLSTDILHMIEQRLGIHFQTVSTNWAGGLVQLEERKLDMLSNIVSTPDRERYLLFSDSYIAPKYAIFTRKDGPPIHEMSDLQGRKVAVENRFRIHDLLLAEYPNIDLSVVDTTADALKALSFGQADAYIGNQGTVNWIAERHVLTNLKIAAIPAELGSSELRFGIRRDWPMLRQLLNKALASITEIEMQQARRRWLGVAAEPGDVMLTADERRWLREHPVLRFTGDPNWLPYEARDDRGNYVGIVADLLKTVESTLGITFEYIPTPTWSESVALARNGEIDVLSETDNSELSSLLRFTRPYLISPVVIVMQDKQDYVESIGQIAAQRIAVIRDYGYVPGIRNKYPDLDYHIVDSIQDGLTAVSTGAVDVLLATLAQASYHIGELGINNIRIVGKTEFDTRLALGVRDELAPLVPLLNRALDTISKGDKQKVLDTWGRSKFAARVDDRRIAFVAAIAGAALLLALLWNYSIRRQKQRLHVSEERFQLALDAASVGLWDWNATTGRVYYSPLWMSMLGYGPEELPHTFDTFRELLHPDDRDEVLINNARMLDDPSVDYEQEFRLRCKDGDYRWILSRGHVFSRDSEGKALRALGTHSDITRRKEAELDVHRLNQDLRAANQRFAMAVKAISLGVWERLTDGSNRLLFDDRLLQIYGFDRRESVTVREWLERVHPEDRHLVTAGIRKVLREGGDAHADFRAYRVDGSMRYVYAAVTLVPGGEGEPDKLIGVNWDITERKIVEEQFGRVVNALPVAIAIADADGTILLANPQAVREFGEGDSLVGMNTDDFYAKENQRTELLAELVRDGQIVAKEIQYRTASNAIIEGMLSAIPILFDGKQALLGVVVNITERRRMEQDLARAKEQAEEANRFKGQFLANMSHEIRTPMNAIIGLGHLLNRTALTLQQQDYLGKIQVSARTLLTLIDDILDLSKIEAGQLCIENIDFDLGEVLDNIATLASTRLADKPVEFLYDVDPAVPARLRGDPYRLTQILTNLVGNATKFTEQGGIVVRIKIVRPGDGLHLQFAVEDTGIGIPPDKVEQLFAPFTQADGSTTREYGGTGLGLSICRQLAELMGGHILAHSVPGEGSRFEFELPFGAAEPSRPARFGPDAPNLRVLLVDDNAIARQVLGDLLLSLAFRVDVAASGSAALKRLVDERRTYDIVLLDWRMPNMDGLETAHRIRTAGLEHPPRIILMTAYGHDALEQDLDLADLDGFLIKPITPSQLLDAVAQSTGPRRNPPVPTRLQRHEPVQYRLHGKVLLVEDNPINQQVAREIMQQMGLEVAIAQNGAESVTQVSRQRPDLVLMDIQMPDMDGYETTAQIRRLDGMESLPIIAMTANAMSGDAERSIEAGMNGHIAKPVDPVLLHHTLHAWLNADGKDLTDSGAERHPSMPDIDSRPTPPTGPPAQLRREGGAPAIDFETGVMRVGGNRALYTRLLADFAARYRDVRQSLETGCEAADAAGVELLLHSLKGVAGNIGASRVQAVATELDVLARTGNIAAVRDGIPQLMRSLEPALTAATAFVAGTTTASHPATRDTTVATDIGQVLVRLAELLAAGDAESLNLAETLPDGDLDTSARRILEALRGHVADYDFSNASAALDRLRAHLGLAQEDTDSAPAQGPDA